MIVELGGFCLPNHYAIDEYCRALTREQGVWGRFPSPIRGAQPGVNYHLIISKMLNMGR